MQRRKRSPALAPDPTPAVISATSEAIPRFLRIEAAADYISSTVWFVRSRIWAKELPAIKLGRRLILDRLDLDAFVQKQKFDQIGTRIHKNAVSHGG